MVLLRDQILTRIATDALHGRGISYQGPRSRGLTARAQERTLWEGEGFAAAIPSVRSDDDDLLAGEGVTTRLEIENLDRTLVSTAGMDLRVGTVYRGKFLRRFRSTREFEEAIKSGELEPIEPDSRGKIVLQHSPMGDSIYYVASHEKITLPVDLSLKIDAKSTTGRLATLCDDVSRSILETGERSPVIVDVRPYAFDLEVEPGKSQLIQAILRHRTSAFMTPAEVRAAPESAQLYENDTLLSLDDRLGEEGLLLRYHTRRAFVARQKTPGPIDVDARAAYDPKDFFQEMGGNGSLLLDPRRFYLMGTREEINLGGVVGVLTRDTADTGTGLWGHFAGFIWQGFRGPITMECRSESARIVHDGDPAGYVRLDKIDRTLRPEELYQGAYQKQDAPRLPKQFKPVA